MIVKRKKSYIRLEEEENTSYSCVVKVVNVQTIFFLYDSSLWEREQNQILQYIILQLQNVDFKLRLTLK